MNNGQMKTDNGLSKIDKRDLLNKVKAMEVEQTVMVAQRWWIREGEEAVAPASSSILSASPPESFMHCQEYLTKLDNWTRKK